MQKRKVKQKARSLDTIVKDIDDIFYARKKAGWR